MRCSRKFLKAGYVRDYVGFRVYGYLGFGVLGLNSLKGVI